jgi:subtilase family serine protease
MRGYRRFAFSTACSALLLSGCGSSAPGPVPLSLAARMWGFDRATYGTYHSVCGPSRYSYRARCMMLVRDDPASRERRPDGSPAGYGPAELQAAYNFDPAGGSGVTVAVVDPYDDPNLEPDLQVYRTQYGLPPCTTQNGCFRKVNEKGGTKYPKPSATWASEESLDVDMVSANCPNCTILVVEANDENYSSLGAAVAEAASLGAATIGNSYGGPEFKNEDLKSPGYAQSRPVTASAGDDAYGGQWPAALDSVISVGGTTLTEGGGSRGWTETVWSGTGGGCTTHSTKPSWQNDSGCKNRTMNDLAYVADPDTGVAFYDSYEADGWGVSGGTSVSAPAIAAMIAAAGNAASIRNPGWIWTGSHSPGVLNDITSGSDGNCSPPYLCNGETGYDGPSGWGTPNGLGAL